MAGYSFLICCLALGLLHTSSVHGEEEPECMDAMDVAHWAFNATVRMLNNDTDADWLDADAIQEVLDHVHMAIGCHDAYCKCLNASLFLGASETLDFPATEALFLTVLRYVYDHDTTCASIMALGSAATSPDLSRALLASSGDQQIVLVRMLGNLATQAAADHSSEEEESDHSDEGHDHSDEGDDHSDEGDDHSDEGDDHGDEEHGHSDEEHGHSDEEHGHSDEEHGHSHEGDDHSDEDHDHNDEGDDHHSDEGDDHHSDEGDDHSHEGDDHSHEGDDHSDEGDDHSDEEHGHSDEHNDNIIVDHGCPHVQCFDAAVAVELLADYSDNMWTPVAALMVHAIVSGTEFAVECGMDSHETEHLPDAAEFIQDVFERLGTESPGHISPGEMEELAGRLGVGGEQHMEEDDGHNHRRKRRSMHEINECYSVPELLLAHALHPDLPLSGNQFSLVCPALVQQVLSENCVEDDDHSSSEEDLTDEQKYGYGTLAVLVVCLAALPGALLYPVLVKRDLRYRLFMSVMIGLAIGSLFGDALLHLIPEALGLHEHDHGDTDPEFEDVTKKTLTACGAAIALFLFESLMHGITRSLQGENTTTSATTTTAVNQRDAESNGTAKSYDNPTYEADVNDVDVRNMVKTKTNTNKTFCAFLMGIKAVAWMVIIGDSLHNFVDGLAMAASFSDGLSAGLSTSLAVLCHELPHELGDFAVLVNAGFSIGQAAFVNFFSACLCFGGLYVGLPLSVSEETRYWIFIITAGLFLYIALSDMVPEAHELQKGPHWVLTLLMQVLGIVIGVGVLLVLAIYEGAINNMDW